MNTTHTSVHRTLLKYALWILLFSELRGAETGNPNNSLTEALAQNNAQTGFVHAAPVSQLSAQAVPSATLGARFLQLNVSWDLPKEGRHPKDLTLEVTPSADPECPSMKCYEAMIPNNATWWLAPPQPSLVQDAECSIRPGCSYRIRVQANPYNGVDAAQLDYNVTECVGPICACRHRMALPGVRVSAQQVHPDTIGVRWNVTGPQYRSNAVLPTDVRVTHFVVSFSEQRVLSAHPRPWFELLQEVKINATQRSATLNADLQPGLRYNIKVRTLDSRGCSGPQGNATIIVKLAYASSEEHTKYTGLLLGVLSLLTIALIITGVVSRCASPWIKRKLGGDTLRTLHHVTWTSRNSQENKLDRFMGLNGHMERNVLYVEKEIEERLILGEVDAFEIWHSRLTLGREVGKGAFGRVFLATAEAINGVPGMQTVAVKKLKKTANADEVDEFLSEIAMLKQIGRHKNIVALLGCCTLRQPYCMVMEYVPCGDLLQYLRTLRTQYEALTRANDPARYSAKYTELLQSRMSDASYILPETSHNASVTDTDTTMLRGSIASGHATSSSSGSSCGTSGMAGAGALHNPETIKTLECVLDHKELQNFAAQIAAGMRHLEEKKITHRDLAARNVLIDETKTLKISDFGLSRSGIYVNTKQKKVPLRWLALESIRDNLYSSKSDVWSFAVVLWEIGTLGGFPYPSISNHELLGHLLNGSRLERPHYVSEELYALMKHCWAASPDDRPTFAQICDALNANKHKIYVDFGSLAPGHAFPPTQGDKT